MPVIDVDKFAATLDGSALPPFGQGRCARFVRLALESAGAETAGHPIDAKDWGPTLLRIGFRTVVVPDVVAFIPNKGDVVVIQATSASASGHMAGYDGVHWVSDFIQPAFWPGPSYRNEKPAFVVYRP